ncbi:MAG: TetR/AcrR family transcriptional regulator [Chloroflexota bacterium]|nr:TetR/AcrR family transcriptional regulator [Chloroflexota bacterium]
MSISVSYVKTGRRKQKERTRAVLVDAARELLARGLTPTVEEAAEAASISRATAYRYFPSRRELLVAAHPEVETTSLLGPEPSDDPSARLDAVVIGLSEIILGAEASYRSMLRMSLDPDPATRGDLSLRQGRRFLWIEDALEPVRGMLTPGQFERLVNAIAASIGIEALVALMDLGGLTPAETVEVMRWSAQALFQRALREADVR